LNPNQAARIAAPSSGASRSAGIGPGPAGGAGSKPIAVRVST
jgi:hypothetical protein